MQCTRCGNPDVEKTNFCPRCGEAVSRSAQNASSATGNPDGQWEQGYRQKHDASKRTIRLVVLSGVITVALVGAGIVIAPKIAELGRNYANASTAQKPSEFETGVRKGFIESGISACISTRHKTLDATKNPSNDQSITDYCTCSMNRLSEQLTVKEILTSNSITPARINAVMKFCMKQPVPPTPHQ